MGNCYVYQHVRLDTNEVFYIGIGSGRNYERANRISRRSNWWNKIVAKAGRRVEIIVDNISWDEACQKEQELILKYGRRDLGKGTLVNMTNGGDGVTGIVMTEEHKRKIGQANKGGKGWTGRTHSEETRRLLSKINKGHKYHLGKKLSEQTKNKIRETLTGKPWTEQRRQNLSKAVKGRPNIALKGKPLSEEHRKKLSEAALKRPKRILTEEHKNNIRLAHLKKRGACV
jgi:hypothetical protein